MNETTDGAPGGTAPGQNGGDWLGEGGALTEGPSTHPAAARTEQAGQAGQAGQADQANQADRANRAGQANQGTTTGRLDADPRTRYPKISPPEQHQEEPGSDRQLEPRADHGEQTYAGSGRLRGKRVLITGADSGIGAAVTIAFAREGATVCMAYLPDESGDADDVTAAIEGSRQDGDVGSVHRLPGDLLDRSYRDGLVATAVETMGGLDVLVNNAGKQVSVDDIAALGDEQIEQTYGVNVFAMMALSRAAAAVMRAGANIINTTSIQAYDPSGHLLDYASTKASINAFTKGLAEQLGERGIRVNAVAPGPIWTPLQPSDGQPTEALPEFGHNTWLGRAGQPAELASAYVFLAEDLASYVTGSTIHVNGGKASP